LFIKVFCFLYAPCPVLLQTSLNQVVDHWLSLFDRDAILPLS
jgi:hypothetical protein